ncbi:hypothetical protein GGR53DRAFT_483648 [Hypoxylon sp. FL1150]|nr:hypothetical protein GGR53DRAFT_483648 [Hypoxylon sp. FL1150]
MDIFETVVNPPSNTLNDTLPPLLPTRSELIKLQVGERDFYIHRDNLTPGISARMVSTQHFVDYDPALFEHVLRYLRTREPPLFFDVDAHTFDHVLYRSLLSAARHFGIAELARWIEKKEYLDAVQVTRAVATIRDVDAVGKTDLQALLGAKASCKVDTSIAWGTRKVYVCPRGLTMHRGNPSQCGWACRRARAQGGKRKGKGAPMFDDELVASAVVVATEVEVKHFPADPKTETKPKTVAERWAERDKKLEKTGESGVW